MCSHLCWIEKVCILQHLDDYIQVQNEPALFNSQLQTAYPPASCHAWDQTFALSLTWANSQLVCGSIHTVIYSFVTYTNYIQHYSYYAAARYNANNRSYDERRLMKMKYFFDHKQLNITNWLQSIVLQLIHLQARLININIKHKD